MAGYLEILDTPSPDPARRILQSNHISSLQFLCAQLSLMSLFIVINKECVVGGDNAQSDLLACQIYTDDDDAP